MYSVKVKLLGLVGVVVTITGLTLSAYGSQAAESATPTLEDTTTGVLVSGYVSDSQGVGDSAVTVEPSASDGSDAVCEADADVVAAIEASEDAPDDVPLDGPPGPGIGCCRKITGQCQNGVELPCPPFTIEVPCPCIPI